MTGKRRKRKMERRSSYIEEERKTVCGWVLMQGVRRKEVNEGAREKEAEGMGMDEERKAGGRVGEEMGQVWRRRGMYVRSC
jgi:hypothetical protein